MTTASLLLSLLALAPAIESVTPASVPEPDGDPIVWLDPQGEPLPFRSEDELLDFLRGARFVSTKPLSQGINRPLKVLLERDGVRAHAIFRTVDKRYFESARRPVTFRDSYIFEVAAYELSRLLGIDRVPPVVERRYRSRQGSLQIWVENAIDETARRRRGLEPPDSALWAEQQLSRSFFDALIYNRDRNLGNLLIDRNWNVWLIDHTRAFGTEMRLDSPQRLSGCPAATWERLRTLDRELVAARLSPYLSRRQLKALFARWDEIVARLDHLSELQGEKSAALAEPAALTAARQQRWCVPGDSS